MNAILDNTSALMRFKTRNGYNISKGATVCAYILTCKLKRILYTEFTDYLFRELMKNHGYSQTTKIDRIDKITQFLTRLDKLPVEAIKAVYDLYEMDGIKAMADVLSMPLLEIEKLPKKLKRKTQGRELVKVVNEMAEAA